MEHELDRLVSQYENGLFSRRELLATLAALMAVPTLGHTAPAAAPPFRCRELNHVTLRVKDLARSRQFYAKLLGLRVITEDKDSCRMALGRGFVSLWKDPVPGIDHWCVGVDAFVKTRSGPDDHSRDSVRDLLRREGFSLRTDEGDSTIYVKDPDGNAIQLEATGFSA